MTEVDLYAFDDYHAYLRAWFEARAGRPSMRGFAKRVGCAVGLVSEVCAGKRRLHQRWAPAFAQALRLDDDERDYFLLLIELERAEDQPEVRRTLEARHAEVQSFRRSPRVAEATARMVSHWYYSAIAELALCAGFREDPAWIAARLGGRITPEQASAALAELFELGRLKRVDGEVEASTMPWVTEHEATQQAISGALRDLHLQMLEQAALALDRTPSAQRHYSTMSLPIPRALVPELKQRVRAFQESVMALCMRHGDDADVVYQLNTQLFPLTHPDDDDG